MDQHFSTEELESHMKELLSDYNIQVKIMKKNDSFVITAVVHYADKFLSSDLWEEHLYMG